MRVGKLLRMIGTKCRLKSSQILPKQATSAIEHSVSDMLNHDCDIKTECCSFDNVFTFKYIHNLNYSFVLPTL
jgi:hypothetical protein